MQTNQDRPSWALSPPDAIRKLAKEYLRLSNLNADLVYCAGIEDQVADKMYQFYKTGAQQHSAQGDKIPELTINIVVTGDAKGNGDDLHRDNTYCVYKTCNDRAVK